MSEPLEKKLISAFATAWNEAVPGMLGGTSELTLLALRAVAGEQMASALAVATTWTDAFVASCDGSLKGILIILFKSTEGAEIERLANQPLDGAPRPGGRALVNSVLKGAVSKLTGAPTAFAIGPATYIDLSHDVSRLSSIVGQAASIGTFMMTLGEIVNTQALLLFAPQGVFEDMNANVAHQSAQTNGAELPSATPNTEPSSQSTPSRRDRQKREEAPKNIERLLEVELDIVVRFGMTQIPLRDVVRVGVGTIIELNRTVDEPVELLVNGRLLARGEVVLVDGYYGVRITEIGAPSERPLSLN
jgi:flagellar motor switch protein FliN